MCVIVGKSTILDWSTLQIVEFAYNELKRTVSCM
jgi:hypothetical protein